MSWWDTARFHALVTLPLSLSGFVAPNRLFASWLARRDIGRHAVRLVADLQRKYRCDHLWLWFPRARTLLVLDRQSIDAVLASGENAADPWLKTAALSCFLPDALVISSGDAWSDRRRFNERVLDFGHPPADAEAFRDIVFGAVEQWAAGQTRRLRWADFQLLALRISHQVLLGAGRIQPEIARHLARLAGASNLLLRRPRDFSALYERIESCLRSHARAAEQDGSKACLVHHGAQLLADGSATASTRVPSQIGFWFFVLKDALELHVARTLALIAAHDEVQDRVRREVSRVPALTPRAIDELPALDACVREQLRLWTPVPLLLRRAVDDFALRGAIPVKASQQLLILAGAYHRDAQIFGAGADRFSPEALSAAFPPVYYFSAGRQSCAGQFVAMFLLKATLAALLQRFRFELVAPKLEPGQIPCSYDHFNIELRALDEGAVAS